MFLFRCCKGERGFLLLTQLEPWPDTDLQLVLLRPWDHEERASRRRGTTGSTTVLGKTQQRCAVFQRRVRGQKGINLVTWHWLSVLSPGLQACSNPPVPGK